MDSEQHQPNDAQVVTAIAQIIADRVSEWYGPQAQLLNRGAPLQQRKLSSFLRYRVQRPDGSVAVVRVKMMRRPYAPTIMAAARIERLRGLARAEYDSLCAVAATFAQGGLDELFAWVRPLAYLEPWAAIVQEELPSTSVGARMYKLPMLLNRADDRAWVVQMLERGCAWLRAYHQLVGGERSEPLQTAPVLAEISRLAEEVERASDGALKLDWIRAAAATLAATVEGEQTPVAGAHTDFHTGNLLVTADGRIAVLDIDGQQRQPIYADVATLLIDMHARRRQVLTCGLYHRRANLRAFEQAILNTYFADQPFSPATLQLYCIQSLLRQWRNVEQKVARQRRRAAPLIWPIQTLARAYFARLARRFLGASAPRVNPRAQRPAAHAEEA